MAARYYDPTTAQFLTRDPLAAVTRSAYGYAAGDPLDTSDPTGLVSCRPGQNGGGCVGGSPLPPGFDTWAQFQPHMNAERASNACQGAQFRADYQETLDGLHALQAAQAAVDAAQARVDYYTRQIANDQWSKEVDLYNRYKNPIQDAVQIGKNAYYCAKGGLPLGAAGAAYGSEGGPLGAAAGGAGGFIAGCVLGVVVKSVPLPVLP